MHSIVTPAIIAHKCPSCNRPKAGEVVQCHRRHQVILTAGVVSRYMEGIPGLSIWKQPVIPALLVHPP